MSPAKEPDDPPLDRLRPMRGGAGEFLETLIEPGTPIAAKTFAVEELC